MTLPRTVTGVLGMMIFIVWIVGMVLAEDTQSPIRTLSEETRTSFNAALNADNPLSFIYETGSVLISFFSLTAQYELEFLKLSSDMPTMFYLFFIIINLGLAIGVLKLVRGVNEV